MFGKHLLFLSSYAPLFGLLSIRFFGVSYWYFIPCLTFTVAGVGALLGILRLNSRANKNSFKLTKVSQAGPEAASYLASYLLPFLTVPEPGWRETIMYVAFIGVALSIHLRTSVVQINPLMYVLGWSILEFESEGGFRGYLATKRVVKAGDTVLCTRLSNEVLVQRT